jgi:hypothetical protein
MWLPRMTTRRWMVAVAVVAAACCTYRLWARQRICRSAIYFHAWSEKADLADAALPPVYRICGMVLLGRTPEEKRRHNESLPSRAEYRAGRLRDAAYHHRVRRKFERAAWRPWEPLPDDPPDPPAAPAVNGGP